MKEMCKSSLSFTVSTKFAKRLEIGHGRDMIQPGLFCEIGQFTKAPQCKHKTRYLELTRRGLKGKAETLSERCFWIIEAGT